MKKREKLKITESNSSPQVGSAIDRSIKIVRTSADGSFYSPNGSVSTPQGKFFWALTQGYMGSLYQDLCDDASELSNGSLPRKDITIGALVTWYYY